MSLKAALSNLAPKSVFITGANRGIGFHLVKHLLDLPTPPCHVFATCRDPSKAQDLQALAAEKPAVHILKLEVTDYAALPEVVTQVESIVGNEGLNLLINNAGVLRGDSFDTATPEEMRDHYEVNTIAPLMIARALVPLLRKAGKETLSASTACIANISSKVGSVGDNTSGGYYAYRTSKCAQNMETKSMSINLKKDKILCVLLHPGWVQTDMGGAKAIHTIEQSVSGMLETLAAMDESHNGSFYEFKGIPIPW